MIASRIGVKGSSRTNVGCAARCHGGLGVSACARILDVGDGTCDHIHAQSSVAVYDTTSGMNMICFFIRGERNNEFQGLSLNQEESFLIVGIVTHFEESHHEKLCTNILHFDLLYLS